MLTRRMFLKQSSLVSLSPILPGIFASTATAAEVGPDERVLVIVQLDGGNDGINTVVPFVDDGYGRVRDKLRLETKKLHKLSDAVGLHPNMQAAKKLFDDGRLSIIQGVGYPNPNRSHFSSMRIWQTARQDKSEHDGYGWLGRMLDQRTTPRGGGTSPNAIFVGEQETPVALWGRRSIATAITRTEDLKLLPELASRQTEFDLASANSALQQFVTKQVLTAYEASDEFQRQELNSSSRSNVSYPDTELASRLKLVSTLLKSNSHARVFYTIQNGYDTHSAQLYTHSRLLGEFSAAIKAFLDDLKAAKLDDRVVLLAFSEFGRRVEENDSQGTDHGTAGPVFLAGSPVSGGLVGIPSDLSELEGGDLKMQIDFRSVYATVLDQWLGVDAEKVLGGNYERLWLIDS